MTFVKIRSTGIAWQQVDDDLIILDEHRSLYLRLTGSANSLWPLIVEGTSPEALATLLVEQFGLPRDTAEQDIAAFLLTLSSNDLVEQAP